MSGDTRDAGIKTYSLSYHPAGHQDTDPREVLPWSGSALMLWEFRPGEDPSRQTQEGFLEEEACSWALKKEANEDRSTRRRVL